MKKESLKIIGGLIAVILIVSGGIFYWKNLRGIGPVVKPPLVTNELLILPFGFSTSVFTKGLGNPRVLAWDPNGVLLASIPGQGKVVALPDKNNDGVADQVVTVLEGLNKPHGIALECFSLGLKKSTCRLYLAETDKVSAYDYQAFDFKATNGTKLFDLPVGGNHYTRSLLITPERKLLVAIGSTCNVCHELDDRRGKVFISDLDGKNLKVFASGLRNSVFMAIHPNTQKIWATEMGRDLLGDDTPPDEINILEEGKNYGWPTCYGKNIHDTDFDKNTYIRNPCMEPFEIPSYIDIPAHSAPLGLAFIPENNAWPKDYWNNLFVAYHGSWNRTIPTGYKVVRYKLDKQGKVLGVEDFISGWLKGGEAVSRPVDLVFHPNGDLYISDDKAGFIYRVTPPR